MHQVGNQPRLYYDARSINHQDSICLPDYTVSHPRRLYKAHIHDHKYHEPQISENIENFIACYCFILWYTYTKFWKNKPTQNTTVPSYYFNNKLMCLNVTFLPAVAFGHRFCCINHWKLRSSFWPSVCWYIIPYMHTQPQIRKCIRQDKKK